MAYAAWSRSACAVLISLRFANHHRLLDQIHCRRYVLRFRQKDIRVAVSPMADTLATKKFQRWGLQVATFWAQVNFQTLTLRHNFSDTLLPVQRIRNVE